MRVHFHRPKGHKNNFMSTAKVTKTQQLHQVQTTDDSASANMLGGEETTAHDWGPSEKQQAAILAIKGYKERRMGGISLLDHYTQLCARIAEETEYDITSLRHAHEVMADIILGALASLSLPGASEMYRPYLQDHTAKVLMLMHEFFNYSSTNTLVHSEMALYRAEHFSLSDEENDEWFDIYHNCVDECLPNHYRIIDISESVKAAA